MFVGIGAHALWRRIDGTRAAEGKTIYRRS
jgi:hypothetical protein